MYAIIWNLVKALWVIVFLAIAVKLFVTNYDSIEKIPTIIKNKLTTIQLKAETSNNMKLFLDKKYGVKISGVSYCPVKNTSSQNLTSSISSSCWNGDCSLVAEFKEKVLNKIPKKITLNVKVGDDKNCIKQEFDIDKKIKIIGYSVLLKLTKEYKEKLNINNGNQEIVFKHQTGYSYEKINGIKTIVFDFDKLLTHDTLLVDGKENSIIDFEIR